MSCSHVKPMPPNTWIAVPPSCGNASAANALRQRRGAVRLLGRRVVERPARVVRRGAAELDRAQHVGAQVLHGLERADRLAELHALLRVLDRELERALRGADTVDHVRHAEPVERARDIGLRRPSSRSTRRAPRERHSALLARAVDRRRRLDGRVRGRRTRRSAPSASRAVTTNSRRPRRRPRGP